jgi:hypothetical protein
MRCETLNDSTTSSVGVGDVNGDGYDDIVQGDEERTPTGVNLASGVVRLWLGSRRGPRSPPIPIRESSPHIPGVAQVGDRFGVVLAVADVDDDGYADMLVSAVGEADASGRVTVIRGNRDGYAQYGNVTYDPSSPLVSGHRVRNGQFGSTITALDLSADERLDVAVVPDADDPAAADVDAGASPAAAASSPGPLFAAPASPTCSSAGCHAPRSASRGNAAH